MLDVNTKLFKPNIEHRIVLRTAYCITRTSRCECKQKQAPNPKVSFCNWWWSVDGTEGNA